ncbi:MAG: cyclic nucleotide-binding domain-containing protein [Rubrobacteraceae bacterium]
MTEVSQSPGKQPLFEDLSSEELDELEVLMEPASFEAGEKIFEEGGPEDYLYVLTSGTIEVHKEVLRGKSQHLATMEAPSFFGELGLLTETRAAATVTAKTRIEAQAFENKALLERLEAGNIAACKVAYQIGRTLARRMAETDQAVAKIITELEDIDTDRDLNIFQDKLIQDWDF